VTEIRKAAANERAELFAEQAARIKSQDDKDIKSAQDKTRLEDKNKRKALTASISAMDSLLSATESFKGKMKPLYVSLAIMRAASATVQGIKVAWDGAEDIGGVPGVVYGIATSIATVATNAALLAGQLTAVQSAATGTDQVVRNEKVFRAGEAGPERVTIRPTSSDMEAGGSGSGGSVVFRNTYNIGGNLDQAAADSIIEAEERLALQIAEMKDDGF